MKKETHAEEECESLQLLSQKLTVRILGYTLRETRTQQSSEDLRIPNKTPVNFACLRQGQIYQARNYAHNGIN